MPGAPPRPPLLRRHLLAVALAVPALARAQDNAIRLMVGVAAGTGLDLAARGFAPAFAAALQTPVVVVNRPSQGMVLAAEAVARAAPDGQTLLFSSLAPLALAPLTIRPLPYHPLRDFTHLARLASGGFVVAVPAASPARDIPGLVALLRQRGAAANYGNAIGMQAYHMVAEMLLRAAGVQAQHIGYRTTGETLTALTTGHLDFMVDLRSLLQPHAEQGALRPLAVTSTEADPGAPHLPPLARFYPGVAMESWMGVSAPAGLAAVLGRRFIAAAETSLADPALLAMIARTGGSPAWLAGPAFTAFVAAEMERIGQLPALTQLNQQG